MPYLRKPKVFSKPTRILTMEHLPLERFGLVLASAYEVCSASAVVVVKALKAPILVKDAPAWECVGSDKLGVGVGEKFTGWGVLLACLTSRQPRSAQAPHFTCTSPALSW